MVKMANKRGSWKISFSVKPDQEDLDHIAEMVREGFREGEIVLNDSQDNYQTQAELEHSRDGFTHVNFGNGIPDVIRKGIMDLFNGEEPSDEFMQGVEEGRKLTEKMRVPSICMTTGRECAYGHSYDPCSDFCDDCSISNNIGFGGLGA